LSADIPGDHLAGGRINGNLPCGVHKTAHADSLRIRADSLWSVLGNRNIKINLGGNVDWDL
jgi:hypothetical protein